MREIDGNLRISASDIANFLACRYLTRLDSGAARKLLERPHFKEVGADKLAERGTRHEQQVRERFMNGGWEVTTIPVDFEHPAVSAAETKAAIRAGVDVIDQGVFLVGPRYGRPDFLVRADLLRDGAEGYEVVDAKLARSAKASAVLQIAFYSRMLTYVQGFQPDYMHLALGGSEALTQFRVASYSSYQDHVDGMLEEFLDSPSNELPGAGVYPEPTEHCAICAWRWTCRAKRREDDHLSLIAGISARQRRLLTDAGITTRRALAALPQPPSIQEMSKPSVLRIHRQAQLQVKAEDTGKHVHHLLEPDRDGDGVLVPGRGLLALPEPSEGDLFFDIEGARFYTEDDKEFGLQYLFGIVDCADADNDRVPVYHAFWAFDRASEKGAFEDLIDFVIARLEVNPDLHVYHYNHYEPTTMDHLSELHQTREEIVGWLMGRHATREAEVDHLLTKRVFVDLYKVIRQGVLASVESYSIKRLEPHYSFRRGVELDEANEHLVLLEAALDDGTADTNLEHATKTAVQGYNEDDCRSTLALRAWLEQLRDELEADMQEPVPRPSPPGEEPEGDLDEIGRLRTALMEGFPTDGSLPSGTQTARKLAADLLEWHRRDDRPRWWRWFHLVSLSDEELVEERDALGLLEYEGIVGTEKNSNLHRFRFPPQEQPFEPGDPGYAHDGKSWVIWDLDEVAATVILKRGKSSNDAMPTSLIEKNIVRTPQHRKRLAELGERVLALGADEWPHDPALDLLLGRPPHVTPARALVLDDEDASTAGRRLAGELIGGYIAVQGPPGTGKTYTGALQILELVGQGKRVGVTAMSHAVIANLLDEARRQAIEQGINLRIGQKPPDADHHVAIGALESGHVYMDHDTPLADLEARDIDVLGGTTWLWAREEYTSSVELLIVDEASQMSLANVLSVTHAAPNLILLGDPQQLGQPSQAAHPPGAGLSALDHVLRGHRTMPPEQGLFIEKTRRMHPSICEFTSSVFYDGRLEGIPGLEHQTVLGDGTLSGSGIRIIPVEHQGNGNSSVEEAAVVATTCREILARLWVRSDLVQMPLTPDEIRIVTPFNAQAAEIRAALVRAGIPGIEVGTVDKFQGQQAAVAIYSMASSSADDAPRGMEFLYDLRRLNVATSRARAMAILVASPDLIRVMCRTPRQIELANAQCASWDFGVVVE